MIQKTISKKNKLVTPFVKWVGGKRQLMPTIKECLPKTYSNYYELFIGGGALLFDIQPKKAIINDVNSELINAYLVIKNNVDELIQDLGKHKNEEDYFYKVRSLDRDFSYEILSDVERASRLIYLNKTCYNGLYRVNNSGEFNSPFGRYKNPNIVNESTLKAVSFYLNSNNIKILNLDFEEAAVGIPRNSFIYLDPPYDPISSSSNFTGYNQGGFDRNEQLRLKNFCDNLNSKGVKFLLSNSSTLFILNLYKEYNIKFVKANRFINSNPDNRGEIDEILVSNYE